MDEKFRSLLRLGHLQTDVAGLFFRAEAAKAAGVYEAARPVYDAYIARSRTYLDAVREFNQRFPESPFDIPPIAQPLVNALLVQADMVQALGDRPAAERLRQEALTVSRTFLGREGAADTQRALAGAMLLEGRFNEAIMALQSARDAVLSQGDPLAMARVAIDLADILQWLGDLRRAKEEIAHAETVLEPLIKEGPPTPGHVLSGLQASMAGILSGRGDSGAGQRAAQLYRAATEVGYYHGLIAKALGEWDEAERCLRQVLPEYQRLGAGPAIAYQLAQIEAGRGRAAEALQQARSIEAHFSQGAFRPKRGVLQRLQAECLLTLGDPSQARRLVDASIADLTEPHFDPDALWRAQWLRARIAAGVGEKAPAVGHFLDAVATIDRLRRAPLGYRLDSTFLADKRPLYAEAIRQTLAAGAAADGCRVMESLKSRTLNAVLSVPASPDGGGAAGPAGELDEATRALDALEFQGYREGWTRDRRIGHRDLLQRRADLLERIRIGDPRWRALTEPLPLDLDAVLAALARRSQAALTLHLDPPYLNAVLLMGGQARGGRRRLTDPTLDNLADYARNLQQSRYNPFKHDFSVEYGVAAADLVPEELLREAVTADSLVVVPHAQLHLLPWGGLVHADRRLFERLPVGILPNLRILPTLADPGAPRLVALVGVSGYAGMDRLDDLPSARGEIEDILSLYRTAELQVLGPLLDEAATEAGFWGFAGGSGGAGCVLHMSCHGTMVPSEPMSSGLLLMDGKIDAAEVARARLPFQEVVLSACSTGWRPTQVQDVALDADEILGIPAGFLEGGASTVLVSIPKAEGETARVLATHYHARRLAGDTPLQALQRAQRHLLGQGAAPGTWVGFTVYGGV